MAALRTSLIFLTFAAPVGIVVFIALYLYCDYLSKNHAASRNLGKSMCGCLNICWEMHRSAALDGVLRQDTYLALKRMGRKSNRRGATFWAENWGEGMRSRRIGESDIKNFLAPESCQIMIFFVGFYTCSNIAVQYLAQQRLRVFSMIMS